MFGLVIGKHLIQSAFYPSGLADSKEELGVALPASVCILREIVIYCILRSIPRCIVRSL